MTATSHAVQTSLVHLNRDKRSRFDSRKVQTCKRFSGLRGVLAMHSAGERVKQKSQNSSASHFVHPPSASNLARSESAFGNLAFDPRNRTCLQDTFPSSLWRIVPVAFVDT